ncbi:MAG TPA: diaminopimelate dehydrogenase [Clostridia bacterium]|jgi:diaminopimelate dehydrogenase|nr:diaminopimelate dehydrogenase [Clostridiaceae bacterium]HPB16673.1 diaminopimelate dehydrogenase [Clostridia bacterium]HQM96943.1 diaminopimelate dehydrogenase [Clostridia bacterium]HQO68915.1 diaminopimelate dehydrogenase [Clostridia bacterium]
MIRTVIVGFGNIGESVLEALLESPDFSVVGIVVTNSHLLNIKTDLPVADDINKFENVQVAILCTPSRMIPLLAESILSKGINTVDAYDMHSGIYELREKLDKIAKENNTASITAAGWDPGTDSAVRALMEIMAPKGITYTDFGPGMSMGHSVAAKAIKGVKNALSMTIPLGTGLHRRIIYVELNDDSDFFSLSKLIKEDDYFAHDETHVIQVSDIKALEDKGHGVNISRKGVSGITHNQNIKFAMSINNPALTGQVLVSCARAVVKQAPGCYTMIEIPLIDMIPGDRESIIRRLV